MSETVVLNNTFAGEKPPSPALKEDGSLFKYRMYFNGMSHIAYSDDITQLCALVLPGYEQADEHTKLKLRLNAVIELQQIERSKLLSYLSTKGTLDRLEDWEAEVLYSSERAPSGWGGHDAESIDFWSSRVPLILLETDYTPYSNVPAPVSGIADVSNPPNIIWMRAQTEVAFLDTLARIGFIDLSTDKYADKAA